MRYLSSGKVFSYSDDLWFEHNYIRKKNLDTAIEAILTTFWSPVKGCSVIEIGCGSGRFLKWLSSQGHMVTGIDLSETLIHEAIRKTPNDVKVFKCDALNLPFKKGSYDVAFFVFSLEFMSAPESAIMEALRIVKEMVFIIAFNPFSPTFWYEKIYYSVINTPLSKLRPLSLPKIRSLVKQKFSEPLSFKYTMVWNNNWKWKNNILAKYLAPVFIIKITKSVRIRLNEYVFAVHKGLATSHSTSFNLPVQYNQYREVGNNERINALQATGQ